MAEQMNYMNEEELVTFLLNNQKSCPNANAISDYVDSGFDINSEVRSGIPGEFQETIENLNNSFQKYIPTQPFCLFRGMRNPLVKRIDKNGVLNDPAYCSTSTSYEVAEKFMQSESSEETCCVIHIHIPAGQPVKLLHICAKKDSLKEKEVLLPPSTKLEVIRDANLLNSIASAKGYKSYNGELLNLVTEKNIAKPEYPIYSFTNQQDEIIKIIIMKKAQESDVTAPSTPDTYDQSTGGGKKKNIKQLMKKTKLLLARLSVKPIR
jgi:hypothetical protein